MWVAGQAWLSVDTDRDVLTRLCEAHDERDAMREQIAVDGFMLPGRVTGTGFDGVLLIPSYFEAGRFTAGDIHWANVSGKLTPAGDTEFAQDATFGYASSNLRDFIAEKSDGTITADQVHCISLDDIRLGGPSRVAEILDGVTGGAFVVVNATDYADLEIVVLGAPGGAGAGQVVRIPLWSVVPPCSGRPRTARPAHRGADLARPVVRAGRGSLSSVPMLA